MNSNGIIIINSRIMLSNRWNRTSRIKVSSNLRRSINRCIRFSFNSLIVPGQITPNDHQRLPTEPCNSSRSLHNPHLNTHHLYPYRHNSNTLVSTKHPNHKNIGLQTLPNQPHPNLISIPILRHLRNHPYLLDRNHPRHLGPLDPQHLLKPRR